MQNIIARTRCQRVMEGIFAPKEQPGEWSRGLLSQKVVAFGPVLATRNPSSPFMNRIGENRIPLVPKSCPYERDGRGPASTRIVRSEGRCASLILDEISPRLASSAQWIITLWKNQD